MALDDAADTESAAVTEDAQTTAEVTVEEVTEQAEQTVQETVDEVVEMTSEAKLAAILAAQPADVQARYGARNPAETLAFFGIEPGMVVAEALPGGGWY